MTRRVRLSDAFVEHVAVDALKEALEEATRAYWLQRAARFDAAIHQPGDFAGLASVDRIEEINDRIRAKADACRAHAGIAPRWVQDITSLDDAEGAA